MASSETEALRAQIEALSGQISAHRAGGSSTSTYPSASSRGGWSRGRGTAHVARGRGAPAPYFARGRGRGRGGAMGGGPHSMQWTAPAIKAAADSGATKAGAGAKNKTLVLNQSTSSSGSSLATGQNGTRTLLSTGTPGATAATAAAKADAKAKWNRLQQHSKVLADMQRFRNKQQGKVYKPTTRRPITTLQERKGLCVFFTRTGMCKRGLTCAYNHDAAKLALCPRVLSAKGCTLKARGKQCLLSHSPNAHRVPHCEFYTRDRICRNADRAERETAQGKAKSKGCLYTHSDKIHPDTPVCEQFAEFAYCEKGEVCDGRHTFVCPEFAAKGTCSRKACRMMHIVSAATSENAEIDELVFERDDAAAFRTDEDDDEEGNGAGPSSRSNKKRKRYDEQPSDDEGQGSDDVDSTHHDIDDVEDFANRPKKKHHDQSFVTQQDFISFGDVSDDDTAEDGDEDEDVNVSARAEDDDDDSASTKEEEEEDEDPERLGSEDEVEIEMAM